MALKIRQPFIYKVDRVRISNSRLYEENDSSYVSIGKLYENSVNLPGIPSIWGFADEEYYYSGDLGCGYLFDLVDSVEINNNRFIFTAIHSDSTVGPVSIYESFFHPNTFSQISHETKIIDLNTRLNSPFILEGSSESFIWVISSDILGGDNKNVFKYHINAGVYTESLTINSGNKLFGENVDNRIVLISCDQSLNQIKVELRNNSTFNITKQEIITSTDLFTTDIKRTFYKKPNYSNWIIHITDDLYSPTYKVPYLLEVNFTGVSTITPLTSGGDFEEVLNIQEVSGYYLGVLQKDYKLYLVKNSTLNNLFTSPSDSIELDLGGTPSWNQAIYKITPTATMLFTSREDINKFQLFKIDFDELDYSTPYDVDTKFLNFFTSSYPSSGDVDKIRLGSEEITVVRSLEKDLDNQGNLLTFSFMEKMNEIVVPSCSLFYPCLSTTKGKNLFPYNIFSNIGLIQFETFSKDISNEVHSKIDRRFQQKTNSSIETWLYTDKGEISIVSKPGSDQIWVCINISGIIFLAKIHKSELYGISKYYHYRNSTAMGIDNRFVAIGMGKTARISYNKLTDKILLVYFMNNLYLGRSFDFDVDPHTYFVFRRKEPGLLDLSFIANLKNSINGNISPFPSDASDSKFHSSPGTSPGTRNKIEKIDSYYKNFEIPYTISSDPEIINNQLVYYFNRTADISNYKDRSIRFIEFEYYYKIEDTVAGTLFNHKEIFRPAGEKDPGLNQFKKLYNDPVKNKIKIYNTIDPAEDNCSFIFDIIPYGQTASHLNKQIYIKPIFGIYSDPTLKGMVDIIEGTLINTGIIIGPLTKSETREKISGLQQSTLTAKIIDYNGKPKNPLISQKISNLNESINLAKLIDNLGLYLTPEILVELEIKSSVNFKIISYININVF